jgi:hypothetical protein
MMWLLRAKRCSALAASWLLPLLVIGVGCSASSSSDDPDALAGGAGRDRGDNDGGTAGTDATDVDASGESEDAWRDPAPTFDGPNKDGPSASDGGAGGTGEGDADGGALPGDAAELDQSAASPDTGQNALDAFDGPALSSNPYGPCSNAGACPIAGSICDSELGCLPPCDRMTGGCAAPSPGGTAHAYCMVTCRLDCGFGKTCPTGMRCIPGTLFCTAN